MMRGDDEKEAEKEGRQERNSETEIDRTKIKTEIQMYT